MRIGAPPNVPAAVYHVVVVTDTDPSGAGDVKSRVTAVEAMTAAQLGDALAAAAQAASVQITVSIQGTATVET